jgi:UDP-glucose 4-epimerase
VVAIFGGLMREKKTPTIFGDGTKTRDYVYVADIVSANVAALTHGDGETMNIGLGREVSDREVYDAVADVCGFTEKPKLTPFRDGEVRHSALDASKAKKVLGWKPEVQFEEGVRKTLGSLTQN